MTNSDDTTGYTQARRHQVVVSTTDVQTQAAERPSQLGNRQLSPLLLARSADGEAQLGKHST
jgi:hypothetical protein